MLMLGPYFLLLREKSDLLGFMLLRQGHIVFFKVNSVKSCFGLEKKSELY